MKNSIVAFTALFLLTVILSPPANAHESGGNWWHPHPGLHWQIQYAGKIDTNLDVAVYDIDLVDTDQWVIDAIHKNGKKVVCYFSAGSFENWRRDAGDFPASTLGRTNGWEGEKWLDIRKLDLLKPIMEARIDMAVQKKCDGVDPDNVEGYDNESGFPLAYKDQLAYNLMIADLAHKAGMAVGLKNDIPQVKDLISHFDFAVNEQCFENDTCLGLVPFIKQNKPVLNIEYKGSTESFCAKANAMNFDSQKKQLKLGPKVDYCR